MPKKLLIVTALLAALALLFLILWCVSDARLKDLCSESAQSLAQALAEYCHDPMEEQYRACIGNMRAFLSAWEKLDGNSEGYQAGCAIYAVMCSDPRTIYEYAGDLMPVMESLSDSLGNRDALQELIRISRIIGH